jgi:NAD+ kinase
MEQTNARTLDPRIFGDQPTLATIDVAFISLEKILPSVFGVLAPRGEVVALVKPQFEVGREHVGKGGVVRDPALHRSAVQRLARYTVLRGWHVLGVTASPLRGPKGNREFFLHCSSHRERPRVHDRQERRGVCVKRVGIVAKPGAAEARGVLTELLDWLTARGLGAVLEKETAALVPAATAPSVGKAELPAQVDLVVVLGGDGTLLSMARAVGDLGVPLLGVNLGGLGFLTATTLDEMRPALEAALAGRMAVDERMMLTVRVLRNGQRLCEYAALNDVVITKSAMSRIIDLAVSVEGQHATAYRADGLIISTPTGSTAYSLSAGGPILFPTMDALVLTPICSHTLTNRPIVLPGSHRVEVTLLADQEVMATVDGQLGVNLKVRDTVEVVKAAARIRLIRFPQKEFFSVLRTKLKWGER